MTRSLTRLAPPASPETARPGPSAAAAATVSASDIVFAILCGAGRRVAMSPEVALVPRQCSAIEEMDRGRAMQRSSRRRQGACAVLVATACGGVWAQAVDLDADRQPLLRSQTRLELERVDPVVEAPTASTARLYRLDRTPSSAVSEELRTRWWLGNGRSSVGAGADWAATPVGSSLRPWRPVLGLRTEVSSHTRLIYEVRGAAAPWASTLPGAANQEVRVALEFRSARSPAQNLRNGLFRVQLSNTSALMLKPRSGGLVVSYRSQF